MDLQTRKLNAIGYLINLQDEKIFSKIESTIIDSQKHDKRNLQPFTKNNTNQIPEMKPVITLRPDKVVLGISKR